MTVMSFRIDLGDVPRCKICHLALHTHLEGHFQRDGLIGAADAVFPENKLIVQRFPAASGHAQERGGQQNDRKHAKFHGLSFLPVPPAQDLFRVQSDAIITQRTGSA